MENNIYYFTKPNIAPESFEIILNYIYGGTVSLEKFDGGKILELLVATDELLCDNQGPALIVLKVKGTGELLGGYNPNGWNSTGDWIESTESFIFSLGDGKDPNHSILSRIKYSNFKCAIDDSPCIGPCFGTSDLAMVESSRVANGKFIYDLPWSCIQNCYERTITSTTNFAIEDYEVFKLIQKTPRTT
ncbi:unnamed protein product [Rhizophagus irregularis]|nr:unnamed protein product [Rhizophagus irregularis]